MKPVWPRAKEFSKYDVFNVRVKVMRLLPVYRRLDGDYEQFKEVVNAGHLLEGIDNEIDIDDDEAYVLAQSLWLEVTGSSVSKDEELFSFIEYLELIKSKAKGFAFQLAEMSSTTSESGKKLIGVIWQTATMRRNFELFGDFVGLDMMKRGINTLLWPYFSLAMYDEMKKVCIGCEGILCGEREDMYQFACNFMKVHSPGRLLSDVHAVAADGFFDQDLIQKLGFINAHFILDQWHLLDSGLVKIFGKSGYELLQGYLVKMVKSESEEDFQLTSELALQRLHNITPRNGALEAKLVDFVERRHTYASHLLAKIPGNRGLHGNACSEQNHWSVISHLNPGVAQGGNTYCEHPVTLIRDLLQRQKARVATTNQLLEGHSQKMRVELGRLRNEPQTWIVNNLLKAAAVLCLPIYERYKRAAERALNDLALDETINEHQTQIYVVRSARYDDAPSRIFKSKNERCVCNERLRELDMCAHEIKVRGGFESSYFLDRHFRRQRVRGSLVGWNESESDFIERLIGFEYEEMDSDRTPVPTMNSTKNDNIINQSSASMLPTKQGGGVKPLGKKQISNILSAVTGGYNSFNREQQFQISNLVLQLQDIMTVDNNQSETIPNTSNEFTIDVPTAMARSTQRKTRAKPMHEIQANVASKKIRKSIQALGLSQDVSGSSHTVQVNGNSSRNIHCGFCNQGHLVTNCPRRQCLKLNAYEYCLTTSNQQDMDNLRDRMKNTNVRTNDEKPPLHLIFGTIPSCLQTRNFVVHRISLLEGDTHDCIENRLFCITFLLCDGYEDVNWSNIWVMGKVMNMLITHKNKTKKYVFDETIHDQTGTSMQNNKVEISIASM
jgi:hypothetical protein